MRPAAGTQAGLKPRLEDGFSSGLWGLGHPSRVEEKFGFDEKVTLCLGAKNRPGPPGLQSLGPYSHTGLHLSPINSLSLVSNTILGTSQPWIL